MNTWNYSKVFTTVKAICADQQLRAASFCWHHLHSVHFFISIVLRRGLHATSHPVWSELCDLFACDLSKPVVVLFLMQYLVPIQQRTGVFFYTLVQLVICSMWLLLAGICNHVLFHSVQTKTNSFFTTFISFTNNPKLKARITTYRDCFHFLQEAGKDLNVCVSPTNSFVLFLCMMIRALLALHRTE